MRTIRFILQKEFRQIFRNKTILAMIVVMPVVQLIVLPLAADYEVRNISLAVVDLDHSIHSQRLVRKLSSGGYFKMVSYGSSFSDALSLIEADKADLALQVPLGFEKNLLNGFSQELFVAVNAINGTKANLGGAYLLSVLRDFGEGLVPSMPTSTTGLNPPQVLLSERYWYNPNMNYRFFMVPGILAILVTMIGGFLSALNIVKEKETGTIEQINVTPIRKHHFILGKLIPFWLLGNVVFTLGLLVSYLVYGIVPVGSLLTLYGFVAAFLLAILGFGLLISTYSDTQQQAMFIMFFFMMIFILMGGLFTPTDSMPEWAKWISRLNPVTYLIAVVRMVVLKGSTMSDVLPYLGVVLLFALILNAWAVFNYRKTNG